MQLCIRQPGSDQVPKRPALLCQVVRALYNAAAAAQEHPPHQHASQKDTKAGSEPAATCRTHPTLLPWGLLPCLEPSRMQLSSLCSLPCSPFPTPPPHVMSAQPCLCSRPAHRPALPASPGFAASLPTVSTATQGESHPLVLHLLGPHLVSSTAALAKEPEDYRKDRGDSREWQQFQHGPGGRLTMPRGRESRAELRSGQAQMKCSHLHSCHSTCLYVALQATSTVLFPPSPCVASSLFLSPTCSFCTRAVQVYATHTPHASSNPARDLCYLSIAHTLCGDLPLLLGQGQRADIDQKLQTDSRTDHQEPSDSLLPTTNPQ